MSDIIYVHENGVRREATADEAEYILATQNDFMLKQAEIEAKAEAEQTARENAIKKLADLGLTADEVAALLG
jgi:hypothetical protein